MAVTLKDVALRAGVSPSAVSRTFTEGASVSTKTRAKVEQAAAELGYRPNALASSLTTGRTKLIGLVANNFRNPAFLEMFDKFTLGLQARGLRPLLVNLSHETEPQNSLRLLRQYNVDGVIVASSTLPGSFANAFREAGIPVVHSFGPADAKPEVHVVGIDNIACGRMAARTLIDRGYRRLCFLGGPADSTSTRDRLVGFKRESRAFADITVTSRFAGAYTFNAGRDAMTAMLAKPLADAFFCADDVLSIGALSALRDAGVQVPEEVGLIGLNDMEMAGWGLIGLTTIRQPIGDIISASIAMMAALLDDPDLRPEVRLFPCQLIERKTLRAGPATSAQIVPDRNLRQTCLGNHPDPKSNLSE